jgi:cell wall-associated NlpC family hydrolase
MVSKIIFAKGGALDAVQVFAHELNFSSIFNRRYQMAAQIPHAYISKSHAFLREEPVDLSTVVSNAKYGEEVDVLDLQGKWARIATRHDGYQGWVEQRWIANQDGDFFTNSQTLRITRLRAHIFSEPDTERGPILSLGFGTRVKVLDSSDPRWIKIQLIAKSKRTGSDAGYVQRGDISIDEKQTFATIVEFAKTFLGLPYAWGGRSSLAGVDCSGFTQMLYNQMGMALPRDSKDQFKWKEFKDVELDKLAPGNLLFWGGSPDTIRHTGMYIGDGQFIHSTVRGQKPYIQVSHLKDPDWNGSHERLSFVQGRTMRG